MDASAARWSVSGRSGGAAYPLLTHQRPVWVAAGIVGSAALPEIRALEMGEDGSPELSGDS